MMKNIFLFSFLLLATPFFAQRNMPAIGRLYGKIVEETSKEPIAYASVTVYRSFPGGKDSLLNGALTEENGDFNITGLPMGSLKVKITYLGNKDLIKQVKISPPNNIEQDLGNLTMISDAQLLGAVEIKAEKSSLTMNLEKRVFSVDKNITSSGGTAEDVLKNVPSVTVDMDGNTKLRDKGATIYVDGKPTLLSLNQIPADQIESIEVISNPSAKYEASTMGGILNIVMKQNRKPGYNGVVSLGAGSQNRYNGMLNLNVNLGKWNVSGFYSINNSDFPAPSYVNRTTLDDAGNALSYYNQDATVNFRNLMQSGRLNVDYAIDNRNTISVAGNLSGGLFNNATNQSYEFLSLNRDITNYGTTQTVSNNNFARNSVEAQWKKTFPTKNKSLITLFNYSWGNKTNASDWNTTSFDTTGIAIDGFPQLVKVTDNSKTNQYLFQMDYVHPINDSTKMEMGVRSFWSLKNQNYFYKPFSSDANDYVVDEQFSQDADVNESINAAYITYSGRWKHQISYQAGVRFEQSSLTGISHLEGQSNFGYDYPSSFNKTLLNAFFPSLYIAKAIDKTSQVGLNFSRKIQRPNFMQIMPGIKSNDRQNLQIGNPALQPEFINMAELNYNKTWGASNWLVSLYLTDETNTIKPLVRPSATDTSILVTTFTNGQAQVTYGIDNTLKMAFGKNFDVMLNANFFRFNVTVDTFTNTGFAFNSKLNLNYRLPASFSVQLNAAYEGNRPMPQGNRQGIAYMDLAVKKSFFNNAASLVFSVNDVFNTRKDITTYALASYVQETMRRRDTRFFKVTLQVPFGKADASFFNKKGGKRAENQDMQEY